MAVPPLEMVDDIITASKCGTTTVALNATVNSFEERKKLGLSVQGTMLVQKPKVLNAIMSKYMKKT